MSLAYNLSLCLLLSPSHTYTCGVGTVRAESGRRDVGAPQGGGKYPHFLSHAHTIHRTLFLSHSLSHTLSLTHTLSLSLSLVRGAGEAVKRGGGGGVGAPQKGSACPRSLPLNLYLSRSHTLSLSFSHTHMHTHTLSLTHTDTLSLLHTLTHTQGRRSEGAEGVAWEHLQEAEHAREKLRSPPLLLYYSRAKS